MKIKRIILAGVCILGMTYGLAQEEKSAEVFLEAYTDQFQELFFEALRQKGIENYDRAEALLLECKQLDPLKPVVDHELAKVLVQRNQLASAEAYALTAVAAAPDEYWYMHTLMDILSAQYKDAESLSGSLPLYMPDIRLNLATWFLSTGEGEKALEYLEGAEDTAEVRSLREKAKNQVANPENPVKTVIYTSPGEADEDEGSGALGAYQKELEELLRSQSWEKALAVGQEAVESYPLQPEFYLGIGQALMGKGEYREAIRRMEEAEFLILEPGPVATKLYQAMADAYTALGNPEKAREYLNKAKAGAQ